jgi:transcriptional regulator NrdR family protein
MRSGRTMWDELCLHYQHGVDTVDRWQTPWASLAEDVDAARFDHVRVLLRRQAREAREWRDACIQYFQTFSRRPVPAGAAEAAADAIEAELRAAGVTEVPSSRIGALAMEQLRGIDQIAYIRFASVYQSFEDLEDLKREVDTLFAERGQTVALDLRGADATRTRP